MTLNNQKHRKVAIAIDPLSEEAHKTIQWAKENFFRQTDEIHAIMIMVLDGEFDEQDDIEIPPTDSLETIKQEFTQEKMRAMDKIVEVIEKDGYKVEKHVFKTNSRHARNVLVDYIEKEKKDCLIMGSRNLSGWKRLFLGSFSDYVQSHVNCPVLIVK